MNTTIIMTFVVILLSLPCQAALADIYQYFDEQGVMHLTNVGATTGKKNVKLIPNKSANTSPQSEPAARTASYSDATTPSGIITSSNMPSSYLDIIHQACDKHGVDPALVHAIVKVESDFNPFALSNKGAMGLMQLMPQTAMDMNVKDSFNPNENIDGGVKYLRSLIDRYEGNLSLALAAYNSGETNVKKWGTIPPFRETQNYVKRVMKLYKGKERATVPHYTIYVGYGPDGALLLTDNPSNHPGKILKKKTDKNL